MSYYFQLYHYFLLLSLLFFNIIIIIIIILGLPSCFIRPITNTLFTHSNTLKNNEWLPDSINLRLFSGKLSNVY